MTQPIIDPAAFAQLQASAGSDFVVELVDTFLEEAPQMLAELRAAQAIASADRFRRAAHSLKSNSLTFGASALAALARSVELGGLAGDPAVDRAHIDELRRAYKEAAAALEAMPRG